MAGKSIVANLELGHRAVVKHQKTTEGFTHDWEVFVQGVSDAPIQHFVEKVVFYLHESFISPQRVIKTPPYVVREKGYGGFILPIDIYFKSSDDHRKTKINYDLFLQNVDSGPIHHAIKEKITFFKPKEEFRKLLLLGHAIEETLPEDSKKSSQSSVSRPASGGKTKPRYDSNGASKLEQGESSVRKSKDVGSKQESNRHRDRSKESYRNKESSKRDSSHLKDSSKSRQPYEKEKKNSGKQKYKEQVVKSNESFEKSKTSSTKAKEPSKPKTKKPDPFSELFGEIIRKGDTSSVSQHKTDKKQKKHKNQDQHGPTEENIPVAKFKSVDSKNKQKGNEKFLLKDFYKNQSGPGKDIENAAKSKKPQKVKEDKGNKKQAIRETVILPREKSLVKKPEKGKHATKPVVQTHKPPAQKEKTPQKKTPSKTKPVKERKVPVTPPTPRKPLSPERLSSSSNSTSSDSRSRSVSVSTECSSRSPRRSRSRSLSKQRNSRSRSRSSYSEKSRSRSPADMSHKSLSKSPSLSASHSGSAMSRSTSSSSCHSSLSLEGVQDSALVNQTAAEPIDRSGSARIRHIENVLTESDDDKGFRSSGEKMTPSPMKKAYSKKRTSEMGSLPSSRQSSCHSGKGASSTSEDEVLPKKKAPKLPKEKKRKKKSAAKAKRAQDAERARMDTTEAEIPSTPSARFDTDDKSDSEKPETFSEKAQRENIELLERCRQLAIHEEYDKINEMMKIVGKQHTIRDGCIAIDYYKLNKITRLRLRNYMDRLDKE